jgi:IPT/TIG domain
MKFTLSLLVLLLVSFTAVAQNAEPVITSIKPSFSPTAGGGEVTITGSGFNPHIVCILPCPTKVRFGNTEVTPKSESDTRLVVTVPSHAAGVVDVTVIVADGRFTTKHNAFAYGNSVMTAYETILLPIYLDGRISGAQGSQWQTDLWVRNNGTTDALLAPWDCPAGQVCPAVFPLTRTLAAGESLHNLPAFFRPPTANPARLLYVSRAEADDLSYQLRFADVSRATLNAGTELPVIHEEQLLDGTTTLLNVPFESRFRVLLRVYDVANTESRFRVTVYAQDSGTGNAPLHTREIVATSADSGDFRLTPAFAQFSIDELRATLLSSVTALRVEVTPLTAGSRYWTFASVTNNDTQFVTLVTPQ